MTAMSDRWWTRVWLPAARDCLRPHRHMVGSRLWPITVLFKRAVACRNPEPKLSPHGGNGWTCQRAWRHGGMHRARNYVWADGGEHAHFAPLPTSGLSVTQW